MKKLFETFVTMEPTAKGRPRSTRGGHTYTPTKTIQAEHRIQEQVGREWGNPPLDIPLKFVLTAYLAKPKSPKNKKFPVTRPDGDNYLKLACDSLNHVMWTDDSIIVDGVVMKRFVNEHYPHPGFNLEVYDMSEETS